MPWRIQYLRLERAHAGCEIQGSEPHPEHMFGHISVRPATFIINKGLLLGATDKER
jgi:hypothetical protein